MAIFVPAALELTPKVERKGDRRRYLQRPLQVGVKTGKTHQRRIRERSSRSPLRGGRGGPCVTNVILQLARPELGIECHPVQRARFLAEGAGKASTAAPRASSESTLGQRRSCL
jgi:hypothetical protein